MAAERIALDEKELDSVNGGSNLRFTRMYGDDFDALAEDTNYWLGQGTSIGEIVQRTYINAFGLTQEEVASTLVLTGKYTEEEATDMAGRFLYDL